MAKTLLLADDSVTIQKVVNISFASEDVTLVTVDNGDDAVERARETHPDLILADVVMPGKSGYEVCEAIKADPELRHIPVLLLTGTFEAFDEERAARIGAAGHVAKPFEAQALVNQVNRLLAEAPSPAPAPEPAHVAPPNAITTPLQKRFSALPRGDNLDKPLKGRAGVYAIRCKPTRRYYIGSSTNLLNTKARWSSNLKAQSKRSLPKRLLPDLLKHGAGSFEFRVLTFCKSDRTHTRKKSLLRQAQKKQRRRLYNP